MEPIVGHWLDPASGALKATPGLDIRLEGQTDPRPNSAPAACPNCGGPLALFATYERSVFLPLTKYELIALEYCSACASESDGFAGGNGFFPSFRQQEEPLALPALSRPVYFHATPTGEPSSASEFEIWREGKVRAKLGGRQISIQPPLEANCDTCGGSLDFVSSVDESWAPDFLNFGGGFGYLFACRSECSPKAAMFYWDCC